MLKGIFNNKKKLINELKEILNEYSNENLELKRKLNIIKRENNKKVENFELNIEVLLETIKKIEEICNDNKRSKVSKEILKEINAIEYYKDR